MVRWSYGQDTERLCLGERSPLAGLEEGGARILLLGTDFASCTTFHLAEYRVPGLQVDNSFAVMPPPGRRWSTVRDTAISGDRFDDRASAAYRRRLMRRLRSQRPHPTVT